MKQNNFINLGNATVTFGTLEPKEIQDCTHQINTGDLSKAITGNFDVSLGDKIKINKITANSGEAVSHGITDNGTMYVLRKGEFIISYTELKDKGSQNEER